MEFVVCSRGLILAVFLGLWSQQISAEISIIPLLKSPAVGENVLLSVGGVTGAIRAFNWYRGEAIVSSNEILSYIPSASPPDTINPGYVDRVRGFPNGSMELLGVTTSDSGSYTVLLQTQSGGQQASVNITIYEIVTKPVIQVLTQSPVENGPLTLRCNSSDLHVSYLWYLEDKVVLNGGRINLTDNNQTLTLSPSSRSDSGSNYTCWVSNAVSKASSDPYRLLISYGPDSPTLTVSPHQALHTVGSAVSLSCWALSHPPAYYSWLLNGISLNQSGPQLLINPLALGDSGNYTCNASNSVTHHYNQTALELRVLEILGKPSITANIPHPVERRDNVTLTCVTSSATQTILWSKDSQSLPSNDRMSLSMDNRTLTISNVSSADTGNYRCEVFNPVSRSTSEPYILTIYYGPNNVKITPQGPITQPLKSQLTLDCMAESVPAPNYTWTVNGTTKGHEGKLVLTDIALNDQGNYTCVVYNPETQLTGSASVYVNVTGNAANENPPPPHLPPWAIALIVIVILVVISLIAALVYFFLIKGSKAKSNEVAMKENSPNPRSDHNFRSSARNPATTGEEINYSEVNFKPGAQKPPQPRPKDNVTEYAEIRR